MAESEICDLSATAMVALLRGGELSAREVIEAHLGRIDVVNPDVNAIVTLVPDAAVAAAEEADARFAAGEPPDPLHGLPIAHKDLVETAGIRTTYGSPLFADWIPDFDALVIERLRASGAITVGKTNTPEFGAGSQTFNAVFGRTRNPYDLTRTCGGSSGGAAAALATGMIPIADGSDLGGSLRNPASFCNVVGFRPSPGRVPVWPSIHAFDTLSVQGPMARNVPDVALLMTAMAGPDSRAPLSIQEPGSVFSGSLERDWTGLRVAWSPRLGDLPVAREVIDAIEPHLGVFEALGGVVDEVDPDLADADDVFHVLRAWKFAMAYGSLLDEHRDGLKDTVVWNIEEGRRLTGEDVAAAEMRRTQVYHSFRSFLETYDFLVTPVSQVAPFPVDTEWVTEIEGTPMGNYIEWMRSCSRITVTSCPALSVPCDFTPEGLPVGLQIVGRPRADLDVLRIGFAFEAVTSAGDRRTVFATPPGD